MRQSRPFALLLLALWLSFSCNYKKIDLSNTCHTATVTACSGTGTVVVLDAGCSGADSARWLIDGQVFTSLSVVYTFHSPQTYPVELTTYVSGNESSETFDVDAADTKALSFQKKLDLPGSQETEGATAMPDGGLAITGTNIDAGGKTTAFVTRTDAAGNVLWHRTFGWPGADLTKAHGITANPDGSTAIVGQTKTGNVDLFYLAAIDADGNKTNDVAMDPYGIDSIAHKGFSIDRRPGGGYLVCGHRQADPSTNRQYVVMEMDGDFNMKTPLSMGNAGTYHIKSVGVGGGFIVAGARHLPHEVTPGGAVIGPFTPIFHVSKWKSILSDEWGFAQSQFDNPSDVSREPFAVAQLADGRVVACGRIQQPGGTPSAYLEVHPATGGTPMVFTLPDGTIAEGIVEAADSEGVVLACTSSEGNGGTPEQDNFLLLKFSLATGEVKWKAAIDQSGVANDARFVTYSPDCGYLVVGRTALGEAGGEQSTFVARIGLNGN